MAKKSVHQYTLKDVIAMRGDEPHDSNFYIFTKKNSAASSALHLPSRSDFYTVLLITRGSLQVKLNLIDYLVEKDSILFVFPHATFQFESFSDDILFYGIAFMPDFLMHSGINKKYLDTLGFLSASHSPKMQIKHDDFNILCNSLDMLYKRSYADIHYPFRHEIIQHLFITFLYELAAIYKNNHKGEDLNLTRKEEIMFRFLKLLPEHFKEERSIKFYAEKLFVTPKYLSQKIKEATGKTAGYFIDEMVMLEAKVLLKNASFSVAEVADELHFSDQFFFSKFFKRIAGITPSEYRKPSS